MDNKALVATFSADENVRIRAEIEQDNYFSVYGRENISKEEDAEIERMIELWGMYCVISEYLDNDGEWQIADSVGMCIYENPLNPFENEYVIDLMKSALDKREAILDQMCAAV